VKEQKANRLGASCWSVALSVRSLTWFVKVPIALIFALTLFRSFRLSLYVFKIMKDPPFRLCAIGLMENCVGFEVRVPKQVCDSVAWSQEQA
jgi:hypothetical protein